MFKRNELLDDPISQWPWTDVRDLIIIPLCLVVVVGAMIIATAFLVQ